MGFYGNITTMYSQNESIKLKTWSTNNIKLASARNRRIFLLECRRRNLVPNHVNHSIKSVQKLFEIEGGKTLNRRIDNFNNRLTNSISRLEINHVNLKITFLEKANRDIMKILGNILPQEMIKEFRRRQLILYNKQFHKIKQANIRKIERLMEMNKPNWNRQEKWFKNLSSIQIPEDVENFLSLGSKFSVAVPVSEIPMNNLITDVEDIIQKTPEENRDLYRTKICSLITNYIHKNRDETYQTDRPYKITREFLKNNQNLIILNSDKGSVTVAMDREDYVRGMHLIINSDSFKRIPRDPTSTVQKKCNNYATKLSNINAISKEQAIIMKCYNSVCPKIYGNPKIHKTGHPLRPIVASIQSPTSKLAEFLADILSNAYDRENNYYIKDSFEFSRCMNNLTIPDGYELASLDVINLFGNIYNEMVIKVINNKWPKIEQHCNIPKALFIEMIEFVLSNNYFTFHEEFYVQSFGCAMGSKLSPILSLYVMDHLLDVCIPLLSYSLVFIKKFVDDLILALPHDGSDEILQVFNSYDPHIQFTIEKEDANRTVPFLDTRVCRVNNMIKLDWYRKDSASNKFIHYKSEHPIQVKINCIKQMKARIENICHPDLVDANLKKLFRIFKENSYPRGMLAKLLFESCTRNTNQIEPKPPDTEDTETHTGGETETTKYGSLPNIGNLTSKIKNCFKNEEIKIATYNTKTISRLYSKLKDPTPKLLRSNVVYKIKCGECENTYVGQTSQWLKNRLALHRSDIVNNNQRCALTTHAVEEKHEINFEDTEILATQTKYNKRLLLEMINIRNQSNPINRKSDTQNLSNVYTYLLTYPNKKEAEYYDGPLDE